jgi:hypothetical protein
MLARIAISILAISFLIVAPNADAMTYLTQTAVIIGTTTISGNAFSVGESTFMVRGGSVGIGVNPSESLEVAGAMKASSMTLTATGTDSYGLTTSSAIHLQAGGIVFPDNSTLRTASRNIKFTVAPSTTLSATNTDWMQIDGSSATLTIGNSRVRMDYSCVLSNSCQDNSETLLTFLIDDVAVEGTTPLEKIRAIPVCGMLCVYQTVTMHYITPEKLAAGSHKLAIAAKTGQDHTWSLNALSNVRCTFIAEELK